MRLFFDSLLLNALVALVVLLVLFYYYATCTFNYWKVRGVPYLKPVPLFGNVQDMTLLRVSVAEGFQKLYQQFEGQSFAGVFQTRQPTLLIRDPELVKTVLVKDFAYFQSRGLPFNTKKDPLSAHLFNLDGESWKNLRTKLSPTFSPSKMKMMFNLMVECAEELITYLEEPARHGEMMEIKEVMSKFTTDVIGTCAFGLQFNSMKDPQSEFREMGRRVFKPAARPTIRRFIRLLLPASLFKYLNIRAVPEEISNFFCSAVKQTIDYREKNNVRRADFMQMLIELKNKGKVEDEATGMNGHTDVFEFTDSVVASQAFIFFLAGLETSSATMSFCLHELAVNPDVQERLREEINEVMSQHPEGFSYDTIEEMTYLDNVLSETLRKYPPSANLIRMVTKPYTIPGTDIVVDKGVRVIIPVYAIHRDHKYYPNPEHFDPDRFTEKVRRTRHNYTYLPFGEGPRICIGMRFGLLQAKVGLALLLSKYRFGVCRLTSNPVVLNPKTVVTTAADGTWLRVTQL